jgi:Ubiquitin-conjugating enzyme
MESTTPQHPAQTQVRLARLRGDRIEMDNIRGPLIDWRVSGWRGSSDPPEAYLVRYHLPSYVAPDRLSQDHLVWFGLPDEYPLVAPVVRMERPPVYHPNVFPDGRICLGTWSWEEGLGFLVIRVARMLLYHADVTNPLHPANGEAAGWYTRKRSRFPLGGRVAFPDPLTRAADEPRRLIITRKWEGM